MINPETQNKQPLLQYMRTFSIHTSRPHVHAYHTQLSKYILSGNSLPPVQSHVNPRNIPRLLHFNLSIDTTYTDHNPQPTEHRRSTASYFVIRLFFLIIIPFSKEQQQVYCVLKSINIITVSTYPVYGTRVFPLFIF